MKNIISKTLFTLVFILFFTQFAVGQLSNFTLNVTPTNETCTANGSLSFATSGTTVGATMLYSIYLLPNTTSPIATISTTSYGGLVAGTYRVIATQSLGAQSGTQQQDVVITNQITALTYQLAGQSMSCNSNGQITVNVTSGTAVSYEIIGGPVIVPPQTSNVFTGLTAGNYQIRVFDNCGEGVVQSFALASVTPGLAISNLINNPPLTCSTVLISHVLSGTSAGSIIYPLTIICTVFPPTGPNIVYNQTITSGSGSSELYAQNITLYPNQSYSYNLTITDGCGNVYIKNSNVLSNIIPTAQPSPMTCNLSQIFIKVVQTVILTSAPAAYANTLPYNYTSGISGGQIVIQNLPPGNYTFTVTDVCGNPHVLNVTVPPPTVQNPSFSVREGCDESSGSVSIRSSNGTITSIFIIEAPLIFCKGICNGY